MAAGGILWTLKPAEVDAQAWRMFAVFSATILGMILQVMDTGAVVLLGLVAAVLSGSMAMSSVLAGFANSSVWLIVSAFLFSHAVASTGLGRRIAFLFIRAFGRKTLGLGYALVASELVMAPALPANTARAGGIIFPVILGISRACGSVPGDSARRLGAFLLLNQFHATIVLSA
jgi:DASS family divalent anion:Na+ symporter